MSDFDIEFKDIGKNILKWREVPQDTVFKLISHSYKPIGKYGPSMIVNMVDRHNVPYAAWAPLSLIKKVALSNPTNDLVMIKNNGLQDHSTIPGHQYFDIRVVIPPRNGA